jgi:hypothetical protein
VTLTESTSKVYLECCAKVRADVYTVTLEEYHGFPGGWEAFVEAPDEVPLYYGRWGSHSRRCLTQWGARRWAKRFVANERKVRLDKLRDELKRRSTTTKETL